MRRETEPQPEPYRALLVAEISGGFFELTGCVDALGKAARLLDSAAPAAAAAAEAAAAASAGGDGGAGAGTFELHLLTTQCGDGDAGFEGPAPNAFTRVLPPRLPRFAVDEAAGGEEALTRDAAETAQARREWTQHGWFLGLRFLSFFAHALARPEVDYFVFADAMDVTVLGDPFPALARLAAAASAAAAAGGSSGSGGDGGGGGLIMSQQEWRLGRHSTYMSERYEACFGVGAGAGEGEGGAGGGGGGVVSLRDLLDAPVLNCGVFGGTRAAVLAVLREMVRGYRRAILGAAAAAPAGAAQAQGGEGAARAREQAARCVSLGMDMAFFNLAVRRLVAPAAEEVLRGGGGGSGGGGGGGGGGDGGGGSASRAFPLTLVANEPLCAPFRNDCGFTYRAAAGDGPLPVAGPGERGSAACEDASPREAPIPRNASLDEGEAWVVAFCERGRSRQEKRDVLCRAPALPFALLHKAAFVRDL